jgi:ATP-dependent DNA helicase RecQ
MTLVVSPLIALMKDQVDALNARDIAATYINSSLSYEDQSARLRGMSRGEYRLVYIAPERFRNARFVESLKGCRISLFAIDEAHCISQWGHDFRPDYLRLREAADGLISSQGRPPLIALTATATPQVRSDIATQLGMTKASSFVAGFDRQNLALRIERVKSDLDRFAAIHQVLNQTKGAGIIYCSTRRAVEAVSSELRRVGLRAGAYHAGLDSAQRGRIQNGFMRGNLDRGDLDVIVATNAFGMGVDKSNIRFVIHYNLPGSIEAYYQEVGRAGRDGLPSICTLLFKDSDIRTHEFFIEGSYPPRPLIEEVYSCLLEMGLETIRITTEALAGRVNCTNEITIKSALIYLEKAGHIKRQQGRDHAITMVDYAPVKDLRVDWMNIALHEAAERRKLRHMTDLAHHRNCLSRFILRYFGDSKQPANCRCSNCRPNLKWTTEAPILRKRQPEPGPANSGAGLPTCVDAAGPRALSEDERLVARKILSCIARMEGKYSKGMVAGVLRGVKAKNIVANELDQLSTYGLLSGHSQDYLTRLINALIVAGCVTQTSGPAPAVGLTTLGAAVMRDQTRVELDLEAVEADTSQE